MGVHMKQAGSKLSRLFASRSSVPKLLGGALARLDLDNLATAVLAAGGAHVVGQLRRTAFAARLHLRCSDEVMSTSIALASAADSLLGKSTHVQISCTAATCGVGYVYRHPGDSRLRGAIAPRYPAIVVARQSAHPRIRRRCSQSAMAPGNPARKWGSLAAPAQSTGGEARSDPVRGRH